VAAGRALTDDPRRSIGRYPYQWLFPGPNSKKVNANRAIALTGPGNTDLILEYKVPDGMLFSLRGVVLGYIENAASPSVWQEGSTELAFTLSVEAAGTRNVDFFTNILTHYGSLESPYPVLGRDEYAPLSVLRWQVTNTGGPAAGNYVFAHLLGLLYPQIEAA
jgi:hypothetical protein